MIELNIIGRIGGDAISKQVNGQFVITWSVAHSHNYTNQNGKKIESTIWVRCNYWVKKDTIAQYIKKGGLVFVKGEPKANAWQKADRSIAASLEIRVTEIQLLSGSRSDAGSSNVAPEEVQHLDNAAGGDGAGFIPVTSDVAVGEDGLPF